MPILIFILAFLALMAAEALSITAIGWIFFDMAFWDGWHAAWDRPVILGLVAICGIVFKS